MQNSSSKRRSLRSTYGVIGELRQNRIAAILVDGEFESVVCAFKNQINATIWIKNVYGNSVIVSGKTFYPFLLKGHRWVSIVSGWLDHSFAENLSKALGAHVIFYSFEDVTMFSDLRLYDRGNVAEIMVQNDCPEGKPARLLSTLDFKRQKLPACFEAFFHYSEVRKLEKGSLTIENIEDYIRTFFRDLKALLVLSVEKERADGTERFQLHDVEDGDIGRVDLIEVRTEQG